MAEHPEFCPRPQCGSPLKKKKRRPSGGMLATVEETFLVCTRPGCSWSKPIGSEIVIKDSKESDQGAEQRAAVEAMSALDN